MNEMPAAGAIGGSANEAGSEFRARVGALLASSILSSAPLSDVGLPIAGARALNLAAETDDYVDDLVVSCADGRRIFVQAKVSAGLTKTPKSAFAKAIEQFCTAVEAGLGDNDCLVLAVAKPSQPLQALGRALEGRRFAVASTPTTTESSADGAARQVIENYVAGDLVDEVLDRLRVWTTDPTDGDGHATLIARMEQFVCAPGQGTAAVLALTDSVRELSRRRAGHDGLGFAQALASRSVELSQDAPDSSPIASARALRRYRADLIRGAHTLRLFGAPAALRDIPLHSADASTKVSDPDGEDRALGCDLVHAARRRGRVSLVGEAGGGKSTALRILVGASAEQVDSPVPILVHARRLTNSASGMTDALVRAACEDTIGAESRTLRSALESELARGRCLIALDGLDEVHDGRTALCEAISEWLDVLPASNEFVVASRPAATSELQILGLPQLELRPPSAPDDTIRAILDAAANARPDIDSKTWKEDRKLWLKTAMERDRHLQETPLMVTAMALLAAESNDLSTLPRKRASILALVLERVIDTWEVECRLRGEVSLGPLQGARAREGIRVTLGVLSTRAIEANDPVVQGAEQEMADRLAQHFDLSPGNAKAAAAEASIFWFNTGLFRDDSGRLLAQPRPFAEVAYAQSQVDQSASSVVAWVRRMRDEPDLWACLEHGSGLSKTAYAAWSTELARDGRIDEFVSWCDAQYDGAQLPLADSTAVVRAVSARLMDSGDGAERMIEALSTFEPEATPADVREGLLEKVPDDRRLVVSTLAATCWGHLDAADLDALYRELVSSARPNRPDHLRPTSQAAPHVFVAPLRDSVWEFASEAALEHIASGLRADAELVASHFAQHGGHAPARVIRALMSAGHFDIAKEVSIPRYAKGLTASSWVQELVDWDLEAEFRLLLGYVSDLAPPRLLSQLELRRLNALVDLFCTARLNWLDTKTLLNHPNVVCGWIDTVAKLAGADRMLLAAQAQMLLQEADELKAAGASDSKILDLFGVAYDGGNNLELDQWQAIESVDETIDCLISVLTCGRYEFTSSAFVALAGCPHVELLTSKLDRALETLRLWRREEAALALLVANGEDPNGGYDRAALRARQWSSHDDPRLRSASASWWSLQATSTRHSEPNTFFGDPDEGVVSAAMRFLPRGRISEDEESMLRTIVTSPRRAWKCRHCDADNDTGQTGCAKCRTAGPDAQKHAERILGIERQPRSVTPSRRPLKPRGALARRRMRHDR